MNCACGNVCVRGKRTHSLSMRLGDSSIPDHGKTIRCGAASVEIEDMSLVAVLQRDLTSYNISCEFCGDQFLANLRRDYLHICQKFVGDSSRARRKTFDAVGHGQSLVDNFPIGLRKFLVQAKREAPEHRCVEPANEDVIDIDLDAREWIGYSFTPHILLSEFVHEESC